MLAHLAPSLCLGSEATLSGADVSPSCAEAVLGVEVSPSRAETVLGVEASPACTKYALGRLKNMYMR